MEIKSFAKSIGKNVGVGGLVGLVAGYFGADPVFTSYAYTGAAVVSNTVKDKTTNGFILNLPQIVAGSGAYVIGAKLGHFVRDYQSVMMQYLM